MFIFSLQVVYTGPECVCRVEGLHLNTTYRFRIRSTNGIAQSVYSDIVAIKTARLASFVMNPLSGPAPPISGLKLSSDGCTISAQGDLEDRVLLGDVCFSEGIHYWEWNVEQYDGKGQPSFGIALAQVSKDKMLDSSNRCACISELMFTLDSGIQTEYRSLQTPSH
ncbi:unnamed protein product [Schistosoma curassoni]|uniref:Fibronectin type-III domain-containing protein n=1 Tax=Schistosoma curassoni TaxID=6186 RepID=A0A3P8F9X4_9TREM|nr:unnamed protein product [Schistosoma curassoni]